MLKIEKLSFDVDVFGKVYSIEYPSFEAQEQYLADLMDTSKKELDVIYDFFDAHGLPKEICKKLQKPHLELLGKAMRDEDGGKA